LFWGSGSFESGLATKVLRESTNQIDEKDGKVSPEVVSVVGGAEGGGCDC
jgi:hypothetical protein